MNNLITQFDQLRQQYHRRLDKLEDRRDQFIKCQEKIIQLTTKEDNLAKASLFLQSLSDVTRIQVLEKISGIVTDALQTVKDKNLIFQMNLTTKANQPVLDMTILDKLSGQSYDVINSFGGGICDIIGLVLRVSLLCKWQPTLSKIIILDEACKHVAQKDQELLAEFVRRLSEALSCQFVWISHSSVLQQAAHKTFEITKIEGVSRVEEKTNI